MEFFDFVYITSGFGLKKNPKSKNLLFLTSEVYSLTEFFDCLEPWLRGFTNQCYVFGLPFNKGQNSEPDLWILENC